jgi:hypothetical protein
MAAVSGKIEVGFRAQRYLKILPNDKRKHRLSRNAIFNVNDKQQTVFFENFTANFRQSFGVIIVKVPHKIP